VKRCGGSEAGRIGFEPFRGTNRNEQSNERLTMTAEGVTDVLTAPADNQWQMADSRRGLITIKSKIKVEGYRALTAGAFLLSIELSSA